MSIAATDRPSRGITAEPGSRTSMADGRRSVRHVFIRDLRLQAEIGLRPHERKSRQPVVIGIDLAVSEGQAPPEKLADVVCYSEVVDMVKSIVAAGHVDLAEALAERIAAGCLADKRVESVRVRVEKPTAIPEAASVGIEIERFQPSGGSRS